MSTQYGDDGMGSRNRWRIGVFVDVGNLYSSVKSVHGHTMVNYRALREFVARDGAVCLLTAFTCHDPDQKPQQDFLNALGLLGYRVVAKPIRRMPDGSVKANIDVQMTVEVMASAPHLDEIVLVTGDGDFVALLDHLARMGKVVRVIGPDQCTAVELIRTCHSFTSLGDIPGIYERTPVNGAAAVGRDQLASG